MFKKFTFGLFLGDVLEQNGKTEKHETIHEDINDDSALLDNRYSGSRKFNVINNVYYHTKLPRLQNTLNNVVRSDNGQLLVLNNERHNNYNDAKLYKNNVTVENSVLINRGRNHKSSRADSFKSNILGQVMSGLNPTLALNKNVRSSNTVGFSILPKYTTSVYHSKPSLNKANVLTPNYRPNSRVIQLWNSVSNGNSLNVNKEALKSSYNIKKITHGNQTSTIITLAKNDQKNSRDTVEKSDRFELIPKFENSFSHLKNWPEDSLKDTQDVDLYEKYTSLRVENNNSNLFPLSKQKVPANETKTKQKVSHKEEFQQDSKWTKIPTVFLEEKPVDLKPLYPDLEPNKPLVLISNSNKTVPTNVNKSPTKNMTTVVAETVSTPVSHVTQDTMIHIYNPATKNATKNSTKTDVNVDPKPNYSPPKKVHIVFASNKNETEYYKSQLNDTFNLDCPTITINTVTRVNNTIQSKEGCTDLNIIINSHVLNSNGNQEHPANSSKVSFEVFQGTHININSATDLQDVTDEDGMDKFVTANSTEPTGSSVSTELTNSTTDYYSSPTTNQDKDQLESEAPVESSVAASEVQAITNPNYDSIFTLSPTTAVSTTEDDEDDEIEDYGPAGIMEYFTSLYARYTYLNPVNYGIFSMAVAPFAAFAAGVIGVATFLFPWAFPGAFDLARSHSYNAFDFTNDITNLLAISNDNNCTTITKWRKRCKQKRR